MLTKEKPLSVSYDLGFEDKHNTEGRAITVEYPEYYLVCVYVPNAQDGLKRIDYRMEWEDDFRAYVGALKEKKPVIVTGDMNVAKEEIDLKNPKSNRGMQDFLIRNVIRCGNAGKRICGFLPVSVSGADRSLQLVVLPFQGKREECRLAY